MQQQSRNEDGDRSIGERIDDLRNDYRRYCSNENADPDAYVERLRDLLETQKESGTGNADQLAAMSAFLDEITADDVDDA